MSNDPFAAPAAPSSGISWQDFNGALLMIEPKSIETGIQTSYGVADAVRADVTVLDGPHGGTNVPDTLVFPKLLQGQLKSQVGAKVLGRLGQGQAKPGQSAPWMLSEATDQDKQTAMQWLQQTATAQPAPAAQPTAAQAWQQQPQQQGGQVPF